MAVLHGRQAELLLDGFVMTSFFRTFQVDPTVAVHDATVFGSASMVKLTGLRDGKGSGEAFFDDTATTGSFDVLKSKYGAATAGAITFGPQGFAVGNRTAMLFAHELKLDSRTIVNDLQKLTFDAEAAQNAIDFGISLHQSAAETVFPFTGTSVDNAVSTANGGVGTVQVTAIAGAAPNVVYRIQHSVDNAIWVDLIAFTAISVANSIQRTEVTGTVNRFLRTTITNGGTTSSVTGVVSFARR